jgi:hypothetical protein
VLALQTVTVFLSIRANPDGRYQSVDFMPQFGELFHALSDIPR